MEIDLKPFKSLDRYLEAAYILLNYPHLSIQSKSVIIDRITGSNNSVLDYLYLQKRIKTQPVLYGGNFLVNKNLDSKINSLLDTVVVMSFETDISKCIFCGCSIFKSNFNFISFYFSYCQFELIFTFP
jgi:hypothetical protein